MATKNSRAEKPILFNGDMVRAILDGRKTQTRRIIKPQPERYVNYKNVEMWFHPGCSARWWDKHRDRYLHEDRIHWKTTPVGSVRWDDTKERQFAAKHIKCPYGVPGDLLWVRETRWINGGYVATDKPTVNREGKVPSIHMPKRACRLSLKVKSVRVERVQEITHKDAAAEGFGVMRTKKTEQHPNGLTWGVLGFSQCWDSTYPGSWDRNDWVWVVDFERYDK